MTVRRRFFDLTRRLSNRLFGPELMHRSRLVRGLWAGWRAIVELLSRHVYQPVRWQQTIDLLASTYADGVFVEVGPRSVLGDMMRRRWHPNRTIFSIDPWESATPRETVAQTLAEIRDVL